MATLGFGSNASNRVNVEYVDPPFRGSNRLPIDGRVRIFQNTGGMATLSKSAAALSALFYEPDRPWVNVMRRELSAAGMDVVGQAADPKAALGQVLEHQPGLIIMHPDIKMIEFLRRNNATPNRYISIIVVAPNLTPKGINALRDMGVNEIAAKPCSVDQLLQRIEAIANKPRPFVEKPTYVGPSRRRKDTPIDFPDRRAN